MSDFTPNIQVFCCHYTSQQALSVSREELQADGFPAGASINRVACGGKLKVSSLLKAFEDGADGVCVVACPVDKCHNLLGSQRAIKRGGAVQKALVELGLEAERISMHHLERGFHQEFVTVAQEMEQRVKAMGPSPIKGDK